MLNIKPKYLVNEKGRKTAAVLSMKEYRALMQRLQDLEDALELDEAVDTAAGFREYAEIRGRTAKRRQTLKDAMAYTVGCSTLNSRDHLV